jgi:hypothetical protein
MEERARYTPRSPTPTAGENRSEVFQELQKLQERQAKIERMMFLASITFALTVLVGVVISTEGGRDAASDTINIIKGIGDSAYQNVVTNCQIPMNKNLDYCVQRELDLTSNWRGIMRNPGGKQNPFDLHGVK